MSLARLAFSCSAGSREIAESRTLVSMNRTVVDLVPAKPAGRAERADLGLHLVLQRFQPRELFHPPGRPFEIRDDQCAQRGIALRCGDPGVAVHMVGHGDRNVLHSIRYSGHRRGSVFGRGTAQDRLWVPKTLSPYATWAYSRIRPPRRSRRRTRTFAPRAGG